MARLSKKKFREQFAVLILTHGRPDTIVTDHYLRQQGYSGRIYYVIDNEDKTADKYYEKYGREKVIMFDKELMSRKTDNADTFGDRRTITHARNASFEIAQKLGLKYWMQLDDDYTRFDYRLYYLDKAQAIRNLDGVFKALVEFYEDIPASSIAMAQGGDFIGGEESDLGLKPIMKRKAMNSFICTNERPFKFLGTFNEDVNTYVTLGGRGQIFLTIPLVSLTQKTSQSQAGGITELYLDYGTYVKSFYTVIHNPSCVKLAMMGGTAETQRIHHHIAWRNAVPKLLSEEHKKPRV